VTAAAPARVALRAASDTVRHRLALACLAEDPPPERFGFDFASATRLLRFTAAMHRHWFRVECHGIEGLPRGPIVLVANHGSHVLAWDGAMIVTSCLLEAEPPRLVHGMAEHRLMDIPFLGGVARRIGATDGRREPCLEILRAGGVVLTFPEGTAALRRPFRDRYRLSRLGHGFMHVAMAAGVPIVPVAVIGAEEEAPLIVHAGWLARLLRTPVAPLSPTLALPLPAKYRIHFGLPMRFEGAASPEAVTRNVAEVQRALQGLVAHGLSQRRHVFI
jgi:1-acyl-sn-glycerol-3-phosphate acyltransferase